MKNRRFAFLIITLAMTTVWLGACGDRTAAPTETPPPSEAPPPSTLPTDTAVPEPTTATPVPASPEQCRSAIMAPAEVIHAVHMGSNWKTNYEPENTLPSEYFEYLRDMNVNWVGISIPLHYDDSMDSTVEREYSGVYVPTWSDDFLRKMIQTYHQYGICVYLTLAFEALEALESDHPVHRYQLGGATPIWDPWDIQPEFWPWAIDHPDHERFVAEFWETYTEQAVHFGRLAEEEGVGLYSLGTETDGLFRTRPSDDWPNDFREELRAMAAAVREVYSGPLTYDMHANVFAVQLTSGQFFWPGSEHLWEDVDLDVIGLSAYFQLADCPPMTAFPVETLEERWESIFQDYLLPLQAANPDRPIFFTEYGHSDSVNAVTEASADSFSPRILVDRDGNGLDDGEEMQANIYQALFNVMDRHPGVVNGLFLWEMLMATEEQWTTEWMSVRAVFFRGRVTEDVIRRYYGGAPRAITPTPIPPSPDTLPQPLGETCEIYTDQFPIEWWNGWTWDGAVDTNSSEVVHSGERAIEVTFGYGGGLILNLNQIDVSPYTWLVFYINGGEEPSQQIGINVGLDDVWATPPLNVSDYIEGGRLEPGQWHQVVIPVSDLAPDDGTINWIRFVEVFGNRTPMFYLDEIRFVTGEP